MPLSIGLAAWLRAAGHDAVHATELELFRAADVDILARAMGDNRIVVTADLDYPRLLALARAEAPGLILFRDGEWSEADVKARFADVLHALPEAEIARSLIVVERNRLRRRRLPIQS